MSRIETIFSERRARALKTLMPFLVGGRPSTGDLAPTLGALERAGASVVEIGIPFSDPIADGPVIAEAMHRAIRDGVTPQSVLDAVANARAGTRLGLVAMVSVSIVHRLGGAAFIRDAAGAGFDGFIFPDVPLEESAPYLEAARRAGASVSLLVAPTTPPERAARIAEVCSGFVYVLARVGVTGSGAAGAHIAHDLSRRFADLRRATPLPIACGFGISTAQDVRSVVAPGGLPGAGADAAIVGSALVRLLETHAGRAPEEAERFCRALAAGLSCGVHPA